MSTFQPPPTWALPVTVDEVTREAYFNPIWLKWFVDLSRELGAGGATSGTGTVTQVAALTLETAGTGLSSTVANGTTTPVITLNVPTASAANRGVLSPADWSTFNAKGAGTVTSVAAITLGTTGTDLSSTVAGSSTTPMITLQVPTASAANRGALASADWSTFNAKQPAFVSGTANYFWATPNGAAGIPSLRAIVAADVPALNYAPNVTYVTPTTLGNATLPASLLAFGCNSAAAQTSVTVNEASTDLASVVALCNQLRAALVANGIVI